MPEDYLPVDASTAADSPNGHCQHSPKKKRKKSSLMSTNSSSHQLPSSKLNGTGNKKDKKRKSPLIDMESPELEISSSPKSSRQTVGSREKILEAEAIVKSEQKKLQQFCFICRIEENKCSGIISCDFPDCYRSYHTVSPILRCVSSFLA